MNEQEKIEQVKKVYQLLNSSTELNCVNSERLANKIVDALYTKEGKGEQVKCGFCGELKNVEVLMCAKCGNHLKLVPSPAKPQLKGYHNVEEFYKEPEPQEEILSDEAIEIRIARFLANQDGLDEVPDDLWKDYLLRAKHIIILTASKNAEEIKELKRLLEHEYNQEGYVTYCVSEAKQEAYLEVVENSMLVDLTVSKEGEWTNTSKGSGKNYRLIGPEFCKVLDLKSGQFKQEG